MLGTSQFLGHSSKEVRMCKCADNSVAMTSITNISRFNTWGSTSILKACRSINYHLTIMSKLNRWSWWLSPTTDDYTRDNNRHYSGGVTIFEIAILIFFAKKNQLRYILSLSAVLRCVCVTTNDNAVEDLIGLVVNLNCLAARLCL